MALDGLPEAHNKFRRSIIEGQDSYDNSAIDKANLFHDLGLEYDVIHVVHPARIQNFVDDFRHIADQGFRRIQINWAHNMMWRDKDIEAFKAGLHELARELRQRWDRGDDLWVQNLGETLQRVRTNSEVTVDWDGAIYANNAVLYRADAMERLRIGHLDEGKNWHTTDSVIPPTATHGRHVCRASSSKQCSGRRSDEQLGPLDER